MLVSVTDFAKESVKVGCMTGVVWSPSQPAMWQNAERKEHPLLPKRLLHSTSTTAKRHYLYHMLQVESPKYRAWPLHRSIHVSIRGLPSTTVRYRRRSSSVHPEDAFTVQATLLRAR